MSSFAASRWLAVFGGTRTLMDPAKTVAASTAKAKKPTRTTTARSNLGIQKVVPISHQLGKFLGGATESSRTHAVKKTWEYIKLHNLQVFSLSLSLCLGVRLLYFIFSLILGRLSSDFYDQRFEWFR